MSVGGGVSSSPDSQGGRRRAASWGATFSALQEREFAWYFAGNLAFFMGFQMQNLLRGYLAFTLTDTAAALGYVAASMALPMLVMAPIGGVVADRVNKRTLLILSQSAAAIASLVMTLLILTDLVEFWHLLAMSVVTGFIFAFNMPARQALVPQLVPQHKLMNAVSLQMGGMNVTRILAPAAAGLLIAPLGVGWVYTLTFAMFCLSVASEFRLPIHGMVVAKQRAPFWDDFAGGFRYIRQHRLIALLLGVGLMFPFFGMPVQQMLPVFAEDVFNTGSAGLGILAASTGVGGLMGALVAANLGSMPHKGRLMLVGGLWMGAFYFAFTQAPGFAPALVFLALGNVGGMIFMTTNNTVIQATVPAEFRGRVMSVMMMSMGLMPLSVLPVTQAADAVGARTAVGVSSLGLVVGIALVFFASRRLRQLRLDPFQHAELSPVQAATLVAEGKLSEEEAAALTIGAKDADREGPGVALAGPMKDARPQARPRGAPVARLPLDPADRPRPPEAAKRPWPARSAIALTAMSTGFVLGFVLPVVGDVWRETRLRVAGWLDPA